MQQKKLHDCKLRNTYIGTDSHLDMNENFETGVVKLQRGERDTLTVAESAGVAVLRVEYDEVPTN